MSAQQLPLTRAVANQHRVIVTDGSAVAGTDDSGLLYLCIQDTKGYSGHLLYLQDREEAIAVANALLAAVRAQDEALAMALAFVIRAVRTACEPDQTYAADRLLAELAELAANETT